jgi:histidinol-phosphatase
VSEVRVPTASLYVVRRHPAADQRVAARRSVGCQHRDTSSPWHAVTEMTLAEDLHLAHQLADEAARVAMKWFGTPIERTSKPDGSIVTAADLAVEDALRAILAAERPKDAVLGEERGQTGRSERIWVIDGIDGTHRFVERRPEWGTLIALRVEEVTVLGILEQPVFACRYFAQLRAGAFRMLRQQDSIERIGVSAVEDLDQARISVPGPEWIRDERSSRIADALNKLISVDLSDHPAAQVAWGGADAAVLFECGPWDLAAPALLVEEAGGRFSDLEGRTTISSGAGVFSNGLIHAAVLSSIA